MARPIDSIIQNGIKVAKEPLRDYLTRRLPAFVLIDADEILDLDLPDVPAVQVGRVHFAYDIGDTTSPHNGVSILVSADGRRYKANAGFARADDIRNYGAVETGDIADALTNYTAILAALAAHNSAFIPSTTLGFHFGNGVITVDSRQSIEGQNRAKVFSTASSFIRCVAQYGGTRISGLNIDMTGAPAGSCAIRLDNGVNPVWGTKIYDMDFQNCVSAISTTSAANFIVEIDIEYVRCSLTRGTQIRLHRSQGFVFMRNVNIDNTFAANVLTNWFDIDIERPAGLVFENVFPNGQGGAWSILNAYNPTYNANVGGVRVDGLTGTEGYIWFKTLRPESQMGWGVLVTDVIYVYGEDLESFASLGFGVYFENVNEGMIGVCAARGPADLGLSPAPPSGGQIALVNSTNLAFSILRANAATSHGIVVSGSSGICAALVVANGNNGYGIADGLGAASNVFLGGDLRNNALGKAALSGANTIYDAAKFLG